MSLVIARDEKVFIIVNCEKLDPVDANILANKIIRAAEKASAQKVKRVVGEVADRQLGKREG